MMDLWLKAFHLIFVIAWMAAMLMYPRLKIYQMRDTPGGQLFEEMKAASNRLRHIIMTPAILGAWALGLTMLIRNPAFLEQGWMQVKLVFVLVMSALHGVFVSWGKRIDRGETGPSDRRLRMTNELPFLLLIAIVILVIVKPF